MSRAAIILAAGEGKRMKSSSPKVLHRVCGKPMLSYTLDLVARVGIEKTVLVIGHGAESVRKNFPQMNAEVVIQEKQQGTADAVKTAMTKLTDHSGTVLVLCADMPLLQTTSVQALIDYHEKQSLSATVLTAKLHDPYGYGRIIRNESGLVARIIEDRDAGHSHKEICEVNTGTYCFAADSLRAALENIRNDNDQQEFYLTDSIEILVESGKDVGAVSCQNADEALGINSRQQLAEAGWIMQSRINAALMDAGVTLLDPSSSFISPGIEIGKDTVIMPQTHIEGASKIGESCVIGPCTSIKDSVLGNRVTIEYSVLRGVTIEDGAKVGPYCSLRPGTLLKQGSKAGTFVEIKKTTLGPGSKVPHLSYIGDADIGVNANVGAGSITCNYDGFAKHPTEIGDEAFIGSDTMLVAPVKIGKEAITGAGSVITRDVPDGALGVERSDQRNIEGYVQNRRTKKDKEAQEEGENDV